MNLTHTLFEDVFYHSTIGMALLIATSDSSSSVVNLQFETCNSSFSEIVGISKNNLQNRFLSEFSSLFSQKEINRCLKVCRTGEASSFDFYVPHLEKHLRIKACMIQESILSLTVEDITLQKAIQSEQEQLYLAVQQAAEAIEITDAEQKILFVNPAFEEITGYSKEEVIGKAPSMLKSGKVPESQYKEMWQTLLSGNKWKGIFINKKKSGELFHEEASISPVFDPDHSISQYVAVKRDITKELQLQANLEQTRKVEAIGFLAGGIAHEFNNILAGIIGFAQMSQKFAEAGSVLEKNLDMILKSTDRATDVVEKIENYTSSECTETTQVDMKSLIEELLQFIQKTTPPTVILHFTQQGEIFPITAAPNKIHEALLNIISNALYAIEKKGEIEIFLHSDTISKEIVTPFNIIPSAVYTIIEVSDNGCGISEQAVKKIFDPFFTTKSLDAGSGMGLSIVSGIMKSHNGYIDVQSSLGLGTVIKLYFPISEVKVSSSPEPLQKQSPSEHILLIEDEEMLRIVMREMLECLGYTVSAATAPDEALQLFDKNPHTYDLIYTDYLMPGMNGVELAIKIRERDKAIPIILSTGNKEEISTKYFNYFSRILKKPQRLEEIERELKTVFSKKRPQ